MKEYTYSEYYVNRLKTMNESCKEYMNKYENEKMKIEFGILPSDDFINGGVEKAMIKEIENSKIDNCIIDNTISKINSPMRTYELTNYANDTYVLNWNCIDLKGGIIKPKRKRKLKLRKK